MITLYQCIIFVSLTLLAISIAVYVFAASIYRAVSELSAKAEEEALKRRKDLIKEKREKLIETARGTDDEHLSDEVKTEVDKLNMELDTIDQSILKSRDKVKALRARNMIVIPGSFLLLAIIASGIAIVTSGIPQTIMGIISIASIVIGLYFIYRNLSAVEHFSRFIDVGMLMEQALDRHAMKRQPIVDMDVWDFELEIKRGVTKEIEYDAFLKRGAVGKNTKVRFLATEELVFPEEKVKSFGLEKSGRMKKPNYFVQQIGTINPTIHVVKSFKVKAPDTPGEYDMSHLILCDEYAGEKNTFTIKVI